MGLVVDGAFKARVVAILNLIIYLYDINIECVLSCAPVNGALDRLYRTVDYKQHRASGSRSSRVSFVNKGDERVGEDGSLDALYFNSHVKEDNCRETTNSKAQ